MYGGRGFQPRWDSCITASFAAMLPRPRPNSDQLQHWVPTPPSQVILTVVGRVGSGPKAVCESVVPSDLGRGSKGLERLAVPWITPPQKSPENSQEKSQCVP